VRLPGAETVSWPEVVWTTIALAGFLINAWALWDALGDRAALKAAGKNGARGIVARANVRREWFRVFKQACFLVVGAVALTRPAADPDRPTTVAGVLVGTVLIAAIVSMVVAAVLDRTERARLLAHLEGAIVKAAAVVTVARAEGREEGAAKARRDEAVRKLAEELATATRVKAEALALAVLAEAEATNHPIEVTIVGTTEPVPVQVVEPEPTDKG